MNKKEFEKRFGRQAYGRDLFLYVNAKVDEAWQWIEEYGKQERAKEREEIIKKINLRTDKYVYRD